MIEALLIVIGLQGRFLPSIYHTFPVSLAAVSSLLILCDILPQDNYWYFWHSRLHVLSILYFIPN